MTARFLTPVALALVLTFSVWSAGLAQRVGQQTQTRTYSVTLQMAPVSPVLIPDPNVPPVLELPPTEEVTAPEEDMTWPGEGDMEAYVDDDMDADVSDDEDVEYEGITPPDETPMEAGGQETPLPAPALIPAIPVDQGQLANHRLQINIADPVLGVLPVDAMPTINIMIRNLTTAESRTLTNVAPTNDVLGGPSAWNFGNNLYLPDGIYEVTVEVNGERANFPHVVVSNPATL